MGIISWLLIGLIAGVLAKLVMPGEDPGGFLATIFIGMLGALVGGLIVDLFGGTGGGGRQRLVHLGSHLGGDRAAGPLQVGGRT